jgi:hypothetical protein
MRAVEGEGRPQSALWVQAEITRACSLRRIPRDEKAYRQADSDDAAVSAGSGHDQIKHDNGSELVDARSNHGVQARSSLDQTADATK